MPRFFILIIPALAIPFFASVSADEEGRNAGGLNEDPITSLDRTHWSFGKLVRPKPPKTTGPRWSLTNIDQFVLAQLEKSNLTPQPRADRATLFRRLSFDLIGLPPSPDQVHALISDTAPDAYDRLVDRLLASHHYGERWAQHWLDLARFAETDGFEHDSTRSDAWRYRDWVIDALCRDVPYDQFIQLQIAGDELKSLENNSTIATAFCLSGPDMPDINSQDERRHNLLNEMTATIGSVFMGLQIGCAQCHDHKYDPISQADFYRLRAVFDPAVKVVNKKSVSVLDETRSSPRPSYLMVRGSWDRPGPQVSPAFPRIANPWEEEFEAANTSASSSGRRLALARWMTRDDHPLITRVIANRLWQFHFGYGLSRSPSDFGMMGDPPSHPLLLDWLATELVRNGWSLKRMHRQIARSATYCQASRAPNEVPALNGQQIAAATSMEAREAMKKALDVDPDNRLLARFPRRRLEGEAIRDAMLATAGVLNTCRGGPGVRPALPQELVNTLLRSQWTTSPNRADHDRRSIYVFARRNLRFPIFEAFDRPDANATCPQRSRSTTAPQSLLLLNSEMSMLIARRLAGLVLNQAGGIADKDPGTAIKLAFQRTLARSPSVEELDQSKAFVKRQTQTFKMESREPKQLALPLPSLGRPGSYTAAALSDLCLALLNSNEFIYVD